MADFLKGVSNFFGLTPSGEINDYDYDERDRQGYDYDRDSRADRAGAPRRGYDSSRNSEYDAEPVLRRSAPTTVELKEPEHVFLKPNSDFQDRFSMAPEIGRRFRDGDIVTFDLSDLEPSQQKRYVDFAAGLALALYGRIDADGSVITLLPDGVDMSVSQRNRMSS